MKALGRFRWIALAVLALGLVAGMVISMQGGDDANKVVGTLGPTPGPNSAGHIESQKKYLERVARSSPNEKSIAVVTLKELTSTSAATDLFRGMSAKVVWIELPGGGQESLEVTQTLQKAVETRASAYAAEIRAEMATLTDEAERTKREETLTSLEQGCICIIAAAVQDTTVGALAQLGEREEVLLVDLPDPLADSLQGWNMQPVPRAETSS